MIDILLVNNKMVLNNEMDSSVNSVYGSLPHFQLQILNLSISYRFKCFFK